MNWTDSGRYLIEESHWRLPRTPVIDINGTVISQDLGRNCPGCHRGLGTIAETIEWLCCPFCHEKLRDSVLIGVHQQPIILHG